MTYNPAKHHRRSIRLKGYDYSSPGAYFVTICLQNRAHLFGKVENGIMLLNDAGIMVDKWYRKLPSKFPDIQCREYAIMPNHFHCIIENISLTREKWKKSMEKSVGAEKPVGADPCVCPPSTTTILPIHGKYIGQLGENVGQLGEHMGSPLSGVAVHGGESGKNGGVPDGFDLGQFDQHVGILGEHKGSSLSAVIQWFKTMTTNEYIRNVQQNNWHPFDGKFWQRNYYEHVIRDDNEFNRIREYVAANPANWDRDEENPGRIIL
jgi:putative transposase